MPRASAGELLATAPGIYVARPEGDAVAHQVFLRGFDAEHGQDMAFSVGGVPVNQPSHIHGQGYADLNFLMPEVVRSMRVREGVYDPRQGDFAVAGSVDFDLGVVERGLRLTATKGSFATEALALVWAPEREAEETFVAVQLRRSDGFTDEGGANRRGSISGAVIGQLALVGPGDLRGRIFVAAHAARAGIAGVVRQDDIDAGRVDLYGTYNNPSATAQSTLTSRALAALELELLRPTGDRSALLLWAGQVDFRSRINNTGFVQRAVSNPAWVGRGDLIEQSNQDSSVGALWTHRTKWMRGASGRRVQLEVGAEVRRNGIDQTQNLLQQPQNQTWDRRVDATVRATDLGAYADADLRLGPRWRIRGGGRAELLAYDVDDRLGNFTSSFQKASHLPGFRRTSQGVAAGPRLALEFKPASDWALHLAYGEGFRSPQARQLEEGETAIFAKVRSAEIGARLAPRDGATVALSAGLFGTTLSRDLVFDPGEGRLEHVGPTTRLGGVVDAQLRPTSWLVASASLTLVHATLDAPPAATAENPVPALAAGQLLPYVPPAVARLDLSAQRALLVAASAPVRGKLGLSASWMSARPLPYRASTPAVFVLDAAAGLRWRAFEFGVHASNLLGNRYAATAYSYVSDWQTQPVPSLLPATHVAAGPPRTVLATLTVSL